MGRFEAAGQARAGAAYLTVVNDGAEPDRLIEDATPVARSAALHRQLMDAGVMRMRPVPALVLPPGAPTVLKPGGLHVMLMGLKAPLRQGQTFPPALTFEGAGRLEVSATFGAVAAREAPAAPAPGAAQ